MALRRPDDELLHALHARHGLRAARWRVVARLDCTLLRIVPERGPELALRIYPLTKQALAPIETELAWLADLAAQGLAVPRPLADREGRLLQRWPDGRHAVLLGWVGGRCLDKGLRALHLRHTGRLIAALHASGDRLAASGRITSVRAADGPDLAAWARDERRPAVAWPQRAQATAVRSAEALIEELAGCPLSPASWGLLHGDLHLWNLVHARGLTGAIDFSDCGWAWRALDFASTLQYLEQPFGRQPRPRRALPGTARTPAARLHRSAAAVAGRETADRRADPRPILARWLSTVEWILDDWPRPDLRPFGPPLLDGVAAILERGGER